MREKPRKIWCPFQQVSKLLFNLATLGISIPLESQVESSVSEILNLDIGFFCDLSLNWIDPVCLSCWLIYASQLCWLLWLGIEATPTLQKDVAVVVLQRMLPDVS